MLTFGRHVILIMAEPDALEKYLAEIGKKSKKRSTPHSAGSPKREWADPDMISLSSHRMDAKRNSDMITELAQKVDRMAYGLSGRLI